MKGKMRSSVLNGSLILLVCFFAVFLYLSYFSENEKPVSENKLRNELADFASTSKCSNKAVDITYFVENFFKAGENITSARNMIVRNGFEIDELFDDDKRSRYIYFAYKKRKLYYTHKTIYVRIYHDNEAIKAVSARYVCRRW